MVRGAFSRSRVRLLFREKMSVAARPLVQVRSIGDAKEAKAVQVALPAVFLAPIRPDIVQFVHTK